MLNLKSLLNQIISNGIFKTGTTMTGQLKLSYNNFIACGYYDSTQTTLEDFINEVKMSSGAMGTVTFSSNDSSHGVSIPGGITYSFIYMPHRSGGINGAANGDNTDYGNILLFYKTWNPSEPRNYVVNVRTKTVSYFSGIYGFSDGITFSSTSNSYYTLILSDGGCYASRASGCPNAYLFTIAINCKSTPQTSWQEIGKFTTNSSYFANDFNFSIVDSTNGSILQCYFAASNGKIYTRGGKNGGNYVGTIACAS